MSRDSRSAPTRATSCSASRSSTPAARTSRSRSTARRAARAPPPTRSCPRRPAPAPSSTCRRRPTTSRRTGTPPRRSPAIQLALGANSPYLLGKELWRETRIPLFEQATDTRSEELKAQGVRPRVWFGERWITSVFDLFEENVRYFPALLPITDDEDPLAVLEARRHPDAVRAAAAQRHDLPLEPAGLRHRRRRAAPARGEPGARRRPDGRRHDGQRRVLLRAGARRWPRASGRCGRRCRSAPPRRTSTSRPSTASTPRSTGPASGRSGPPSWCCAGCCRWPTRAWPRGASTAEERDRLLGIIEQRCLTGRTAPSGSCAGCAPRAGPGPRSTRCGPRCCDYRERMHTNEPVHTWD